MNIRRFLLFLLPGSALANPGLNYTNFVRQTQLDTGVEWDVSVASQGQSLSAQGVGPQGSNFELWAIHGPTVQSFLLDEQYVSSFAPNGKITITSADPYPLVTRTRVDQPFTVTIAVSGLDDGTSGLDPLLIPDAAKRIGLTRGGMIYPAGSHSPASGVSPTPISESFVASNGNAVLQFNMTALTGPDMTEVEGEEVFTTNSLASFGAAAAVLDSKRIQIWPIASASIGGVDSNTKYVELPQISVVFNDLYPTSSTFVRAYFGAPSATPSGASMLLGTYVVVNDSVPQDRDLTIEDVDDVFTKDGNYTLEVVHVTPFGTEVLTQFYPLQINRTIVVNASLFSE